MYSVQFDILNTKIVLNSIIIHDNKQVHILKINKELPKVLRREKTKREVQEKVMGEVERESTERRRGEQLAKNVVRESKEENSER